MTMEPSKEKEFVRKGRYTNLRSAYLYKMAVFLAIVVVTIVKATDFETLLVGAMTFLPCIYMDLHIIIISNHGPRRGKLINLAHCLKYVVFVICIAIVGYLVADKRFSDCWQEMADFVLRFTMVLFCFLGPLTELFLNKPEDD